MATPFEALSVTPNACANENSRTVVRLNYRLDHTSVVGHMGHVHTKIQSFLFFSLFLFAMERSTLNSEVPSLQTYRFVPGTTAEKHEHSEFANCCQTDPAAI